MATLKVTLHSQPFMDDPPDAETYFTALGRALVLWGRFESHLDFALVSLTLLPEGKPYKPEQMPVPFTKKAKLWKRIFRDVDRLAPMREQARLLISDAIQAAKDRNILAHGHWNGFLKSDLLTARVRHTRRKGSKMVINDYEISVAKLEDLISTFDSLNTRLLPITWNLSTMFWQKTSNGMPE